MTGSSTPRPIDAQAPSIFARAGRIAEVVRALIRFLVPWAIPALRQAPLNVTAREGLERLGGAWIKLGQALALRFDILPDEFCLEFFKLLNQVRPFAAADVVATIEAELGQPLDRLFAAFEPEPFAAASIGQVHRATLADGHRVAVKVQRPGIEKKFALDIALMSVVARWVDRFSLFGGGNAAAVVREFSRWTALELDYTIEARYGTQLWTNADGDPCERNAVVHWTHTTRRVLTTELIDGILLIDIVSAVQRRDEDDLRKLHAAGYRLDRIMRTIDWNLFNQTYVHGQFHADLHPANLFVLPDNRIGYVDFGITGRFSPLLRRSMVRYSQSFFDGDADGAASELLRWMTPGVGTDGERARADMVLVHEAFSFHASSRPYGRKEGVYALEVMRVVREHGLRLAPEIVTYLKLLATAETLREVLAPEYDLRAAVLRFLRRARRDEIYRALDPQQLLSGGYDLLRRANDSLGFVDEGRGPVGLLVDSLTSVRRQAEALRRRLLWLGLAALSGIALLGAGLIPASDAAFLPVGLRPGRAMASMIGVAVALILLTMLSQRRHLSAMRRRAETAEDALSTQWASSGAR